MVAGLFLVALVSFALMGLLLAALTIYTGLSDRSRSVDRAGVALAAAFARRRALLADLEVPPPGGPGTGERLADLRARATADRPLGEWASFDVEVSRFLGDVLAAEDPRRPPEVPGAEAHSRRLEDVEAAVSAALAAYNRAVAEFSRARSPLPAALVARVAGLRERSPLGGLPGSAGESGSGATPGRR